jgi:choline dehydrogenase-like flavoprotein
MVYIRGHRDNYDAWRDLGNPGWGWSDVLPYFRKSEDNTRGASEYHGAGGPLGVCDLDAHPLCHAFVASTAARCKVAVTDDFNGAEQEGAGIYQNTVRDRRRASTAVCFLDPVRDRPNLTVATFALAIALVLDGDRVTGVRCRTPGGEEVFEGREIILSGGAIGSPHLLLLSGIGPADELRDAGVTPKHELAGVGKHLEDHLMVPLVFEAPSAPNMARHTLPLWALQYLVARRGPLSRPSPPAGAFVRSKPDMPRPDVQFHMLPFGWAPPNSDERRAPPFGRLMAFAPGLIYPRSHGEVRLRSADPVSAPAIDPRYFSDPADLEHLVDGVELSREIAATAPLSKAIGAETFPGPRAKSREDIRAHVRRAVQTIFHPTGTCKMGTDEMAVVDPRLRVRGLRNLRIADASIMPSIIGGNTNAPTIMIAEKAADMILEDG